MLKKSVFKKKRVNFFSKLVALFPVSKIIHNLLNNFKLCIMQYKNLWPLQIYSCNVDFNLRSNYELFSFIVGKRSKLPPGNVLAL